VLPTDAAYIPKEQLLHPHIVFKSLKDHTSFLLPPPTIRTPNITILFMAYNIAV
jgi:hypothetical protein